MIYRKKLPTKVKGVRLNNEELKQVAKKQKGLNFSDYVRSKIL